VPFKFLGLAILYGIKEKAKKISFVRTDSGETMFNVEAAGRYKLPGPLPSVAEKIFTVMRSITRLESPKAKEPLFLGLRNDQGDLLILSFTIFKTADPQPRNTIVPELFGKARLIERGVLILIEADTFGNLHRVIGEIETWVELGTVGILDTVWRPFTSLPLKAHMLKGVPVTGCVYG